MQLFPALLYLMIIVGKIIIAVIYTLIAIGNVVLICITYITSVVNTLYTSSKPVLKETKKRLTVLDEYAFTVLHTLFRTLGLVFSTLWNNLQFRQKKLKLFFYRRPVLKTKLKHKKKLKKITIFPLFWGMRFRYFIIGTIFSFLFLFLPLLFYLLAQYLPNPHELSLNQIPQTTKIYDRNHTVLYEIYATQNRTLVNISDLPKNLINATIATEDKNFYTNPGFDITAIIRAAIADITGHEIQGGSTLTQQLIKSSLLTSQRSISRKIEEIALAFWAEKIYSKQEILHMYFNQVPYGGTAWGAEAGAEVYFNKRVQDLDLAECAFLAGLPRAPSIYSPFGTTPNAWKNRQKDVLRRMQELGYISKQQQLDTAKEELHFQSPQVPIRAPHFVMYLKDLLVKKYGLPLVERGGLQVITSLDLPTQDMVQHIVTNEVSKDGYLNLTNGAAVITDPRNGDVLAMIGSKDYNSPDGGSVNLAIAHRQPGSSIKVVTYAAALTHGMTAATTIDDTPITYTAAGSPPYAPVNYDGKWHGRVTMRTALANSLNIPAVKTLNSIGIPTFVSLAKNMGVSSLGDPTQYGLSITLGGAEVTMLDMATVYGTLANQGYRVDINPILKITDNKGTLYEEKNAVLKTSVLDSGVTFILSNILADNNARSMEFGPNSPLNLQGHIVSVKTGTSDNKRDNWTMGYTKDKVVTVWVGNNDNSPMSETLASGITGAAPIWHDIMSSLLKNQQDNPYTPPRNIVQRQCSGKFEYFILGTENSMNCSNPQPAITPLLLFNQPIEDFILPPRIRGRK